MDGVMPGWEKLAPVRARRDPVVPSATQPNGVKVVDVVETPEEVVVVVPGETGLE